MLSDSKLPVIFWGEAINTACYVLNRVLMVKKENKTCYELLNNRKPNLSGFEPFGVPCTLLKTRDQPNLVKRPMRDISLDMSLDHLINESLINPLVV